MVWRNWLRVHPAMRRFEKGQGLVEYALILVLISVVAIAILITVGVDVYEVFDNLSKRIVP